MELIEASTFHKSYEDRLPQLDRTLHPSDDMYAKSKNGWSDYEIVGRSTISMLVKAMLFTKKMDLAKYWISGVVMAESLGIYASLFLMQK